MLNINKIFLTGRLTRNPETRTLPNGSAVVTLSLAINRRYQAQGEWKEETFFIDVETWGRLAERCADTDRFYKGRPVFVEGRLKIDSWERDGIKRQSTRVNADNVTAFDVPKGGGEVADADMPAVEDPFKPTAAPYAAPMPEPGVTPRASDGLNWGKGNDPSQTPPPADDIPF